MINRYARTASAAAVGAIIAGLLPGMASAAATAGVAVTPPAAFKSGAAEATPFKVNLTGADSVATDVSLRFTLSNGQSAFDKGDVRLDVMGPDNNWSQIAFDDAIRGTSAVKFNLAAGAPTKAVDLRVQIVDPLVDGPLQLQTELLNNADNSVVATDYDQLNVVGKTAPEMAVSALTPASVESGKYVTFDTTMSNKGREVYGTAIKINVSAGTVPAGTELFLQRHQWGPYWEDIPMTGTGGVFTTTERRLLERDGLYTDEAQTYSWRVTSSDPRVLGKLSVTAALVDVDAPSTVLAQATKEGTLTASTVKTALTVTGFETDGKPAVLKTSTPATATTPATPATTASGTITVKNDHASETFAGQPRLVLDGGLTGLDSGDIHGTWVDTATSASNYVGFRPERGKLVADLPAVSLVAGASVSGTLTLTLTDEGRNGAVKLDVKVLSEKTTYNSATKTLQLEATTTLAQTTGVQFFGTKSGQAVVSWKAPAEQQDSEVDVYVDVLGAEGDMVGDDYRNDVSRTLYHLPAGVPVTVAVRTETYDYATGIQRSSVPVIKTYTAPAVALAKPTDLRVTPDDSYGQLDELVSWEGSADLYKVTVTDTTTDERHRRITGIPAVPLQYMTNTVAGRTYNISVAAYDDVADKWGAAVTSTYTPREPIASGAKLISVRGTNVVTWKADPQALYTATVNGKAIPMSGSSLPVDGLLKAGTNTVVVIGENRHGTDSVELTVTSSTVKAAASARKVVFGDAVRFSGTIAATPLAGRSLQVEQYNPAKKVWASVATAKTNAKGEYAASVKPSRTANYRVVLLVSGGSAGARSAVTAITVAPKTSLTASDTSVRRGETVTLTAKPAGAAAGTKVTFQQLVGKTWKTVGTAKVAKGAASVKVKMTTRGTVSLRAVVAGNSATTGATSGTVKVTVK